MRDDDYAEEDDQFINDDDESDARSTSSGSSGSSDSEKEVVMKRRVATRGKGDEKLMGGLDEAKAENLASDRGWWAQFMKDPEDPMAGKPPPPPSPEEQWADNEGAEHVRHLTGDNFKSVLKSIDNALVMFYAPW